MTPLFPNPSNSNSNNNNKSPLSLAISMMSKPVLSNKTLKTGQILHLQVNPLTQQTNHSQNPQAILLLLMKSERISLNSGFDPLIHHLENLTLLPHRSHLLSNRSHFKNFIKEMSLQDRRVVVEPLNQVVSMLTNPFQGG